MEFVLGMDIGTSSVKTGLFDIHGNMLDLESSEYSINYPQTGWVEQNPEEWWEGMKRNVRILLSRHNVRDKIISLSLSTQGGVSIYLDENRKLLYPAVSWFDTRAEEVVPLLSKDISFHEIYHLCGFPALGRLNFSMAIWFRQKKPDIFKKCRYFASAVDYLNLKLTGEFVIDTSNLAHNSFLDMNRCDYSERIMEIAGINAEQLPRIVSSGSVVGVLSTEASEELGLNRNVKVISGGHDQYCANIGVGAVDEGDCVLSAGTAWALLATAGKPYFDDQYRVFPGIHILEGKYGLMSAVSAGGNSLSWFNNTFCSEKSIREIDASAEKVPVGASGLIFIPQLNAKSGKGAFLGIDNYHSLPYFSRAVMEGVAVCNQIALDRIVELGLPIKKIFMIGGGAKSGCWTKIVSDMAGLPVFIPEHREAPCTGAALLALTGIGVYNSIAEACKTVSGRGNYVQPDPANRHVYTKLAADVLNCFDNI